jgi:transposase
MNVSSENPVSVSQSPNTGKKKPGRKAILSIYKDKLLALVRSGVSIEDAAIALGIGESTIYLWKQMGAKQRSACIVAFWRR